jgi:hypothetical protein
VIKIDSYKNDDKKVAGVFERQVEDKRQRKRRMTIYTYIYLSNCKQYNL